MSRILYKDIMALLIQAGVEPRLDQTGSYLEVFSEDLEVVCAALSPLLGEGIGERNARYFKTTRWVVYTDPTGVVRVQHPPRVD